MQGRPLGASFNGIAPVRCFVAWGSFDNSGTASIYVAHGMVRADIVATGANGPLTMHLIFDSQKNLYMWDEGASTGEYVGASTAQVNANTDSSLMQSLIPSIAQTEACQPWWTPDESLFSIPTAVDFQADTP